MITEDDIPRIPRTKKLSREITDEHRLEELRLFAEEIGRVQGKICIRCGQSTCTSNRSTSDCLGWTARELLRYLGYMPKRST